MSYPTPPPMAAAALPSLRASCSFCRGRKIKCSGESTGCRTCLARRQPCVFEYTSPMGRPRKNLTDGSSSEGSISGAKKAPRRRSSLTPTEPKRRLKVDNPSTAANTSRKIPRTVTSADLCEGLVKLRLSPVKTTYDAFANGTVGEMLNAFYGLVSPAPCPSSLPTPSSTTSFDRDEPSHPSLRVPQETRALYESRFQSPALQASRTPRTSTLKLAKEAATHQLWGWLGSEILSSATEGKVEGCFLSRLLQEDQSKPFNDISRKLGEPWNPLLGISGSDIDIILNRWFAHSPLAYLVDERLLRSSITNRIADPALLSVLLGVGLTLPQDASPNSSDSNLALSSGYIAHGMSLLFSRSTYGAATSLSTVQAMLVLGVHLGTQHRIREAWALMASGYALAREMMKRVDEGRTVDKAEQEGLRNALWTFAIFGSWAFLSLDLPRSTLVDVTDSLALPSLTPPPSIPNATHALFAHTTQVLSLVVALSLPALPPSYSPSSPSALPALPAPMGVGDPRLARMPAFAVSVANWLLGLGEGWMPTGTVGERPSSPLLAASCAVLAMHRLAPERLEEEERVGEQLMVQGWRMVLRCVEMLVNAEAGERGRGVGPRSGLRMVIAGALPRALALLSRLIQLGPTSAAYAELLLLEHGRISLLQANLIALSHRPSLPTLSAFPSHPDVGAFTFPLPPLPPVPAPALGRSDSSSSSSADTLYTPFAPTFKADLSYAPDMLLGGGGGGGGGEFPHPFPSPPSSHALPLSPTDGLAPSAFMLPYSSSTAPPRLYPCPLLTAALSLPSPPQEKERHLELVGKGKKTRVLSPLDVIRKVLGKGKGGSKRVRSTVSVELEGRRRVGA